MSDPSRCPFTSSVHNGENPAISGAFLSTATGIRTPVSAVRGRRPSPLDDGGSGGHSSGGLRLPRFIGRLGGAVASWVRGRPESAQSADARGRLRGGVLCAAGRGLRVVAGPL